MNEKELQELARELERWTRRPPRSTPQMARAKFMARLDQRSAGPAAWRRAAAVALVAAGALTGLVILGPRLPGERPSVVRSVEQDARSSDGMVVYELRSGAKLYFTLARPPTLGVTNGRDAEGEG